MLVIGVGAIAGSQPAEPQPIRRAIGAAQTMCASLLEAQKTAESQGRIDFSVVVEASGDRERIDMTAAHVSMGSPYDVVRIHFTGRGDINDSTLRRAFTLRERDLSAAAPFMPSTSHSRWRCLDATAVGRPPSPNAHFVRGFGGTGPRRAVSRRSC